MNQSPAQPPMVPIRRYLLIRIVGITLFAILTFAIAADLLLVRPAQDEIALTTMELAADRVADVVQHQVERTGLVLLSLKDLTSPTRARYQGAADLTHAAISHMRNHPFLPQIAFARSDGLAVFIDRTDDGYRVRELDSRGGNRKQRWQSFNAVGQPVGNTHTVERDFDARERPWFEGAIAAGSGQVFITEPFVFFETKVPGLTFAVAESDPQGGAVWVVAANLWLEAASELTSGLQIGVSGGVALLTSDGRLLGLPRDPAGKAPDLSKLLQEPATAGLGVLAQA